MDYTLQLPEKVLCYIFCFARLVNKTPTKKRPPSSQLNRERDRIQMLTWISLTHVCSRWRAMALRDTSLWTDVPSTLGTRWRNEFFSRSGEQAISFDWGQIWPGFPVKVTPEVMADIVKEHHGRLRNFRASLRPDGPLDFSLSLFWPELEELDIKLYGALSASLLLAGRAPRLRHLTYHSSSASNNSITFPWPSLNSLVLLALHLPDGIHGPSMVAFIDALGRMPGLQRLRLSSEPFENNDNELPHNLRSQTHCDCGSTASTRLQPVPLKTLALNCNWSMILHILSHVCPPPFVRISLVSHDNMLENDPNDYAQDSLRHACNQIRKWRRAQDESRILDDVTNHYAAPYISLKVLFDWDPQYEARVLRFLVSCSPIFSTKLRDDAWYKGVAGVHPDLEVSHRLPPDNDEMQIAITMLAQFLRTLDADSLNMLTFCEHAAEDPSDFPDHFLGYLSDAVFQNIKVLRLPCFSSRYIFSIIGLGDADFDDDKSEDNDGKSDSVSSGGHYGLFPQLKVLDFEDSSMWQMTAHDILSALGELLDIRRNARVYLRIAEQVDMLRHYENDSQTARNTIDVLSTMRRARVIESDADIPYADALGPKWEESCEADEIEMGEEEKDSEGDGEVENEGRGE